MLKRNVETFLCCDAAYEAAHIVLFGAPFDSTTSYRPGARFGSRAIRNESYGLESYSPYQEKDLEDCAIFDSGDLELPLGSSILALEQIKERTTTILEDAKIPFLLGGEHLVTLGAVQAMVKKYPDLHIIHFDAHADLRAEYLGVELSHACVLRRCWDVLGDGRIFQFGIRSGAREEFIWSKASHTFMQKFNFTGLQQVMQQLQGKPIYFTLDLDVLDPSVFPGTGTPEPGGVGFLELLQAIHIVCKNSKIVGCDVNELCPTYDQSGVSTAVACKVVRELLLALSERW